MYDKYVYFAARYIIESKKMNRVTLEAIAKVYDKKYLVSHIRTLDTIMDEYRKAEEKLKKKQKAEKTHKPSLKKTSSSPNIKIVDAKDKISATVSRSAHRKASVDKVRSTTNTIKKK